MLYRSLLVRNINTIQSCANMLAHADACSSDRRARKRHHSSVMLLRCLQLAFSTKGGATTLVDTITLALHATFPAATAAALVRSMQEQPVLPSATLVKESRFIFDIALLLDFGDRQSDSKLRYVMADSSPKHGRNWLWIAEDAVRTDSSVALMLDGWSLVEALRQHSRQEDTQEDVGVFSDDRILRLANNLLHGLEFYVHTPVVLGSGQCGVVQEAVAMTHVFTIACRARYERLTAYMSEVKALCTDMGTEMGMSSLQVQAHEILPAWFRTASASRMRGHNLDEELCGSADEPLVVRGGSMRSCSELSGSSQGMGRPNEILAGAGDAPSHVAHVAAEPELPPVAPPQQRRAGEWFLPRALCVPGFQHIVDGLIAEAHRGLEHWATFHAQLKVLERLLNRRWRRERYIRTCVEGTPFEHRTHLLIDWSASLYEKRWREVLNFLRKLKPILELVGATFDARKYTGGSLNDADNKSEQEDGPWDPQVAASILRSNFFKMYVSFALDIDEIPQALGRWASGCPCHSHLVCGKSTYYVRSLMSLHYGAAGSCPLGGKRACEVAAGEVDTVMQRLGRVTLGELLAMRDASTTEAEVQILHRDFERCQKCC